MAIDLTPTSAMQTAASRGLEWRKKFGRGGTAVGVARARDIVNGKELSPETVGRMVSFFARHGVNRAEHFDLVDGEPTPWRVAWELWGGDAGQRWAESKWKQLQAEKMKQKLFKVNGIEVTLDDLASAWLEKQAAIQEVEAAPPKQAVEKVWGFEEIYKNDERQIVYGLILRPDKDDSQGDILTPDDVMDTAHFYMAKQAGAADWHHKADIPRSEAVLVESVIMGADVSEWHGRPVKLKKGDWVGGMKIFNKEKWEAVKRGEIQAFSIRGYGKRIPLG